MKRAESNRLRAWCWTEEQISFLRDNYGKLSAKAIAEVIGRKEQSVFVHAYKLRLTIPVKGRTFTPTRLSPDAIQKYLDGASIEQIGKDFALPICAVRRDLDRMNIPKRTRREAACHGLAMALTADAQRRRAISLSARRQGITIAEWKKFKKPENKKLGNSPDWKQWRIAVFRRDHFRCVLCRDKSILSHRITLDPHHIIPKAQCAELMFCVDNGVTLCRPCHRSISRKEHLYADMFHDHVSSTKELEV